MQLLGVPRAEGREAALLGAPQFSGLGAGCWQHCSEASWLRAVRSML